MSAEYVRLAEVESGNIGNRLHAAMLTSVYNSMRYVHQGMQDTGFEDSPTIEIKSDDTFRTEYDKESERIAAKVYVDVGVRFRGEEGTEFGAGDIEAGVDALDGTRSYVVGGGDPTVLNVLSLKSGEIIGAAIGHPATGKILSVFGDQPVELRQIDTENGIGQTKRFNPNVRIKQAPLDKGQQIFIDNNQPFTRTRRNDTKVTTMTRRQHMSLRRAIQAQDLGTLELGSNGAHQLSVVIGKKAAASITTARGVWEDTAAGFHIGERAGGVTQHYRTTSEGLIVPAKASNRDYDMGVLANSPATLEVVDEMIMGLNNRCEARL